MNAKQLLDVLRDRGMLAPNLIADLRQQVLKAKGPIPPQRVLRILVENGHLTEFQAKKLLREVATTKRKADAARLQTAQPADLDLAPLEEDDLGLKPLPGEDDLGLAPLPEDKPQKPKQPTAPVPVARVTSDRPTKAAATKPASPQKQPEASPKQPTAGRTAAKPTPARQTPRPQQPATPKPDAAEAPGKPTPPQERPAPKQEAAQPTPAKQQPRPQQPATPKAAAAPAPEAATQAPAQKGADEVQPKADSPQTPKPVEVAPVEAAAVVEDAGPKPLSDGLSDLLDDDVLGGEDLSAGTALLPAKPAKRGLLDFFRPSKTSKKTKAGSWDSPLILLGSGALILLIVFGTVVAVFLSRGSGDKLFDQAENAYREQSYSSAIKMYEKFFSRHSGHPKASFARVRHAVAQIRFPLEVENDLEKALSEAQRVLPLVADEEAFDQARSELTSILPDIADGFSQRAHEAKTPEAKRSWLALTDQALDLVNNPAYLPTSAREGIQARIDSIEQDKAVVEKFLRRERRLEQTVTAIQAAVAKAATDEAYEARTTLLKEYPNLASRQELHEAVLSITAKMGDKIRVGPSQASALTNDRSPPAGQSVLLAARTGDSAPGLEDHVLYLIAEGAAYAVSARDGQVLWRRFVDFHPGTRIDPVSNEAGCDALLLDASHQELLRLGATDGKLIWRLPLGARIRGVRRVADHLVVADETGRLVLIEPESGKPTLEAFLPQGIATSVGVTSDEKTLLVAGDHSNFYLLAADTLACKSVVYLGQEPETVQVPPVECLGRLLVFVNTGLDYATLHVFAPGEEDATWQQAQEPLRLQQNVLVEPVVTGPHVICLTDRGALKVFEVNPTQASQPLREVASTQVSTEDVVAGAMLYENGHLWVADVQLTRYRVNLALGQIERTWVDHRGDTFLGWLANRDRVIFSARRPRGLAGTTVASLQIGGTGASERAISPLWSADFGVAPAGPPLVGQANQGLVCVAMSADAFFVDDADIESGQCTSPAFRLGLQIPRFTASAAVDVARGMAFPGQDGSTRWLMFDPSSADTPFRLVKHGDGERKMTALPVAFGKTLLLPLDNGQVHAVDPTTGQSKTLPFQPPLRPSQTIAWRSPCVLAAEKQFVIADAEGNLHRVGIEPGTPPLLKSLASSRAAGAIQSALAASSQAIYAVIDQGDHEALVAFHRQDLETIATFDLAGGTIMGPEPLGDSVVLATDKEGLLAFNGSGEKVWTIALGGERPAGMPAAVAGGFVLATTKGRILRLDGDGEIVTDDDSGEPILYGPLVYKDKLVVSGPDGTLRILPIPDAPATD